MNELEERAAIVEWLESDEGQDWSRELHRVQSVLGYRRLPGEVVPGAVAFASVEWDHTCFPHAICDPARGVFYLVKAYDTEQISRATVEWGWTKDDMADIPASLSSPA